MVLGSGWGALSFVRKLDPSAFDATEPRGFSSMFSWLVYVKFMLLYVGLCWGPLVDWSCRLVFASVT